MSILILGLGSYKVKDTTGFDPDNFDRQTLYAVALNRLCEIAPDSTNIVIVENTAASISELHQPLKEALLLPKITDVLFSLNNSLGAKNKGAGEYGLCQHALAKRPDLFEAAEWVIYYTHRHPISFPLIFDYLKTYQSHDAIVSSAAYLFSDGTSSTPAAGIFDDLIFSMKRPVFLKYIESMNPEGLVEKRMGSEQNLFNFLTSGGFNFKQVERFGVFRYNYHTFQMEIV